MLKYSVVLEEQYVTTFPALNTPEQQHADDWKLVDISYNYMRYVMYSQYDLSSSQLTDSMTENNSHYRNLSNEH